MDAQTDLELHAEGLKKLAKSAYHDIELKNKARMLIELVERVLGSSDYDENQLKEFEYFLSRIMLHLEGSTANILPYEIGYCMRRAIEDWTTQDFAIATAQDEEFYFDHLSWNIVREFTTNDNLESFLTGNLVLVAAPRKYFHLPIFCTALYHELGHFVDSIYGVSKKAYLLDLAQGTQIFENESHCEEHFCDLFAASYTGTAFLDSLIHLTSNSNDENEENDTHPPISNRIDVINNFLDGNLCHELNLFQTVFSIKNLSIRLQQKFVSPRIEPDFNDVRPYKIRSVRELHGILVSGWNYLKDIRSGNGPTWATELSNLRQVQVVNDLIEKSIRNFAIEEQWKETKID